MKFTCNQKALDKALGTVGRAVSSRSNLPVLNNVLIATDGVGRLKLSATNLEIGITAGLLATVEEAGSITVPASLFSDLVRQSPDERISITLTGDTVRYVCGSLDSTIKGISADEFPNVIDAVEGESITLPAALLKTMIARTVFAAANDDSRPILTGALMALSSGELTMVATDGFRLSKNVAHLDDFPEGLASRIIVPARALNELSRVLGDVEAVEIAITSIGHQAIFRADDVTIITQLIDGNFPDVGRLIPKDYGTLTTIDASVLQKAVKRCNIFVRDSANVVRLSIKAGEEGRGVLAIAGDGGELGKHEEELSCLVDGESMEVAMNALYLMEALGQFDGAVGIKGTSSVAPGLLEPANDSGFQHVIMPMHINKQG